MIQECLALFGKRDESTYLVGEYCRQYGEVLIALVDDSRVLQQQGGSRLAWTGMSC